jgi:peptidoglycan/LPS O-acetylase OafA/YrhL
MLLSNILRKENNNLDIFRVVAAFMVIYGHAYALLPVEGQRDIVGRLLVFDYSGSLAVKIFFFLSGLVVTNSLIEKKDIRQFVISRVFRLWPALVVVLAAWAFILGPIFSINSFQEYFSDSAVYEYFFRGLVMDIRYDLPGVFQRNAFKSANGSLWSIPFEVYAYIVLVAIFLLHIINSKRLSVIIFLVILIDPVIGNKLLFTWLPQNFEITLLAPCFALGSLFALFKDKIEIHIAGFASVWILYLLFKISAYNFYFFYVAIFYSIIFVSSRVWTLKFKPTSDISYGVYLWGWPVQQVMAQYFPDHGIRFNQISSIIISASLGYISWRLIESRFIKIGSNFGKRAFSKTCEG